jgi:PAS domain S-box-containing protein
MGKRQNEGQIQLESLPSAILVFDSEQKLQRWNRSLQELSGYATDELNSLRLKDFFHDEDALPITNAIEAAQKKGCSTTAATIITKKGELKPTQFTVHLLRCHGSNDAVLCGFFTFENRTKRSQQSLDNYQKLFHEIPFGIINLKALVGQKGEARDFYILDVNPAFEQKIGVNRDKICNKNWTNDFLPQLKSYLFDVYEKLEQTGTSHKSILHLKQVDKYFEIHTFPTHGVHLTGILYDVTDSRKAGEEKKQLRSQLLQSQKIESIGRLAGGVAHDFNNLLTAIDGYADLALLQIDKKDRLKDSLKQIRLAAEKAGNLSHQLLFYSRRTNVEFKPHNLSEIVKHLFNMIKRIIGENIAVKLELSDELWVNRVDQVQIERVLMNLAVNAQDAMTGGGTLVIRTRNVQVDKYFVKSFPYSRPGQFVCLTVEDTGIGMDKATIDHLFEPFFTTKENGEGTGLGLSVVYGIIKEHHGWINVFSKPGQGAKFEIYLPATPEKAFEIDEREDSSLLQFLRGRGERILFVEDNEPVREFMTNQLSSKGYNVSEADNVGKAMEIFKKRKHKFDLLVTDIVLPDKRGIELAENLLSDDPHIKVLFTSGYMNNKAEWVYIKEKNYPFLQKPYTLVNLLQIMRQSLDNNR